MTSRMTLGERLLGPAGKDVDIVAQPLHRWWGRGALLEETVYRLVAPRARADLRIVDRNGTLGLAALTTEAGRIPFLADKPLMEPGRLVAWRHCQLLRLALDALLGDQLGESQPLPSLERWALGGIADAITSFRVGRPRVVPPAFDGRMACDARITRLSFSVGSGALLLPWTCELTERRELRTSPTQAVGLRLWHGDHEAKAVTTGWASDGWTVADGLCVPLQHAVLLALFGSTPLRVADRLREQDEQLVSYGLIRRVVADGTSVIAALGKSALQSALESGPVTMDEVPGAPVEVRTTETAWRDGKLVVDAEVDEASEVSHPPVICRLAFTVDRHGWTLDGLEPGTQPS
jgi:hypothetical protein